MQFLDLSNLPDEKRHKILQILGQPCDPDLNLSRDSTDPPQTPLPPQALPIQPQQSPQPPYYYNYNNYRPQQQQHQSQESQYPQIFAHMQPPLSHLTSHTNPHPGHPQHPHQARPSLSYNMFNPYDNRQNNNFFAPQAFHNQYAYMQQHPPQHLQQQHESNYQHQNGRYGQPQHHQQQQEYMNPVMSRFAAPQKPYIYTPQTPSPHMMYTLTPMDRVYPNPQSVISSHNSPPSNISSSPLTINSQHIDHENISDSPDSETPMIQQQMADVSVNDDSYQAHSEDYDVKDLINSETGSDPEESVIIVVDQERLSSPFFKPTEVEEQQTIDTVVAVTPSQEEPEVSPPQEEEKLPEEKLPEPEVPVVIPPPAQPKSWASIASKATVVPPKPSASQPPSTTPSVISKNYNANNQTRNAVKSPVSDDPSEKESSEVSASPVPNATTTPTPSEAGGDKPEEKKSKKAKKADAMNVVKVKYEEDRLAGRIAEKVKGYRLKHAFPAIVPSGLTNRGNYCYINAVLQALLASPPFYNLMRDVLTVVQGYPRTESCTPILDSFVRFFAQFPPCHDLRAKLKNAQQKNVLKTTLEGLVSSSYEPNVIRQALKFIGMTNEFQEDAEEFFSNVINGLNDEFIAVLKNSENNGNENGTDFGKDSREPENDDNLWKEVGIKSKNKTLFTRTANVVATPIADIFQGFTLDVRTIANQTKEQKDVGNRQPFFSFQVDIKDPSIVTLEDAIRWRTQSEAIDGYICSQTKQPLPASSQTFLEQLPPILALHFKLFDYDPATNSSSKVMKRIKFEESFDIPKECLSRNHRGIKKYKLLAVVSHSGTEAQKGHYIAEVYHIGLNKWLRCDDANVKVTELNQVLRGSEANLFPYLLFYRRCDTIARDGQPLPTNAPVNGKNANRVPNRTPNAFVTQNRYSHSSARN